MKSWKTTTWGLLGTIGGAVTLAIQTGKLDASHWPWLGTIAALFSIVAPAGIGAAARDNDKTSEQVGAGETPSSSRGPLMLLMLLGVVLIALAFTGCTTALHSDKLVSVKQRSFGIIVGQSPSTQSPEIHMGFVSTVWQMVPTSTNVIYAPKYAGTFDLHQGLNPFGTGISETTATGDVETGTNGATSAIIPK